MQSQRLIYGAIGFSLFLTSCQGTSNSESITAAAPDPNSVVLYEGLPHQMFEKKVLANEVQNKATWQLFNYAFYQEPLELSKDDAKSLLALLTDQQTFKPFSGEKKCGGFHPDYAVAWQTGSNKHHALICFGCGEVKLFGPDGESRHDLDWIANPKLKKLLNERHKNRPARNDP